MNRPRFQFGNILRNIRKRKVKVLNILFTIEDGQCINMGNGIMYLDRKWFKMFKKIMSLSKREWKKRQNRGKHETND